MTWYLICLHINHEENEFDWDIVPESKLEHFLNEGWIVFDESTDYRRLSHAMRMM